MTVPPTILDSHPVNALGRKYPKQSTSLGACPVRDLARKSGDGIVLRQARHIAGE